jgi:hypothetical protein
LFLEIYWSYAGMKIKWVICVKVWNAWYLFACVKLSVFVTGVCFDSRVDLIWYEFELLLMEHLFSLRCLCMWYYFVLFSHAHYL